MDLAAIRAELVVLERFAYLNAGTFGPLPRRTLAAMATAQRLDLERGRTGAWYPAEILELPERVRARLAAAVAVAPESIALTRSTSEGCSIVCAGLGLGPGDEVVTTDLEHFGLLGPLAASGAQVRVARLRERHPEEALQALTALVGDSTRLLALSHVAWTNGQLLPATELAGLGVPVLLDGAQSVGALQVELAETGAAFCAFSGQKWLLGPDTTGGLYVAPEWVERLAVAAPSYYAQQGYDDSGRFDPVAGAARFDSGWLSRAALVGPPGLARLPGRGGPRAVQAGPRAQRALPGVPGRAQDRGRDRARAGDARLLAQRRRRCGVAPAGRAGGGGPPPAPASLGAGLGGILDERGRPRATRRRRGPGRVGPAPSGRAQMQPSLSLGAPPSSPSLSVAPEV